MLVNMLNQIPSEQREAAIALLKKACDELGVPIDRASRVIYWHAHRVRKKLTSIAQLEEWLPHLDDLVRRWNQEVALRQLRRQGPPLSHEVFEED
jgi:hypothetical protein